MAQVPANTYASPINLRIPLTVPQNVPAEFTTFTKNLYNTLQQIIQAFTTYCGVNSRPTTQWSSLSGSPSTILAQNMGRFYATAFEAIQYGSPISLQVKNGILGAVNASATNNTQPCDGFCNTTGSIPQGSVGEVILGNGICTGEFTAGSRYYLGTAPGSFQDSAPSTSGNIEQYLGIALSSTELYFTSHYWIQH